MTCTPSGFVQRRGVPEFPSDRPAAFASSPCGQREPSAGNRNRDEQTSDCEEHDHVQLLEDRVRFC